MLKLLLPSLVVLIVVLVGLAFAEFCLNPATRDWVFRRDRKGKSMIDEVREAYRKGKSDPPSR